MPKKEKWISFREDPQIIRKMDELAETQGICRSGLCRQTMREKLKAEADAVYCRYK